MARNASYMDARHDPVLTKKYERQCVKLVFFKTCLDGRLESERMRKWIELNLDHVDVVTAFTK